ncbi:MAG: DUF4380 domain-containing protein [Chthonomonadales bacterium]
MTWFTHFVLTLSTVLAVVSPASSQSPKKETSPTVSHVDYHGMPALRLSNDLIEVIYVPILGRTMRFARVGGANFLYENPALIGKKPIPPAEAKDWQNYGGDKVWNAPQDRWGWPPDPTIDPGTQDVSIKGNHLMVRGGISAKHNIRVEREIWIVKGETVHMRDIITNTALNPQDWSVWQIMQIPSPEYALMPANPKGGYVNLSDTAPNSGIVTEKGKEIHIIRDSTKPGKVGSLAPIRSLTAKVRAGVVTMRAVPHKAEVGTYPHKGSRQEVYWNNDPLEYVELEIAGPIQTIQPGKSIEMTIEWTLKPTK